MQKSHKNLIFLIEVELHLVNDHFGDCVFAALQAFLASEWLVDNKCCSYLCRHILFIFMFLCLMYLGCLNKDDA